jgi:aldehyde dehydrogenase (NAD+)
MHYQNLIGGVWKDSATGRTFASINPALNSDIVGHFPQSSAADVDAAVQAARAAFRTWSRLPAPARGDLLRRIGDLLTERKAEMAREMTREMGKPFFETKGDVQEAIDTAYYAATETRRLFGHTVPSELPNKFNMSIRRPIGVCGIITAWNFPVAVPTWKIFPALAAGNTVVFKPSEDAPRSGMLLVQVLLDAGLPAGVINLLHGARGTPGRERGFLHRVVRDGIEDRRGVRADAQTPLAGDGRQEPHRGDGRCRPRPGARRGALGGVRHDGPALHRHKPPHRPRSRT